MKDNNNLSNNQNIQHITIEITLKEMEEMYMQNQFYENIKVE